MYIQFPRGIVFTLGHYRLTSYSPKPKQVMVWACMQAAMGHGFRVQGLGLFEWFNTQLMTPAHDFANQRTQTLRVQGPK